MGVFFQIALRNLAQAKRRTALLGLAITAVTTLLVLLLGLSQGVTDTMVRSATTLSSGHVNVAGFFKAKPTDAAPLITKTPELRKIATENVEGLDFVIDRARGWARVISETSSLYAGLTGIELDEEQRLFETIALANESEYKEGGRPVVLGDIQGLRDPAGCLIFAAQAKRLGVGVGDNLTVTVETMGGARNTAEFKIVAVAKDIGFMSNWSFFTTKEGIRKLYQLDADVSGAVMIYLKDHTRATEVMGQLREVYAKAGYKVMEHDPRAFWMKFENVAGEDWTGQQLDLTIWSDEVSFLTSMLTAIDSVSFILVTILMIIIAIGIMNSMWMAVRERTTEIGTLRAIGMSRGRVLFMFLLEAVILALGATILGSLLGFGIAWGLDSAKIGIPVDAVRLILMNDVLHLLVGPQQVLRAVITFTVIAGLAALWPAFRASRMQPVTAIQHVT